MARRLPAGAPGRAGLRLQVEHGLDARHARLPQARADLPAVPPPPDDVLADVRLLGELRAAALARRGGARQGLAAGQDARRRVAAVRRACARCSPTCGRIPGKQLLFMGGGVRPGRRVVGGAAGSTGGCSTSTATRASSGWSATSTGSTRAPRAVARRTPRPTASAGSTPTTPRATCSRSSATAQEHGSAAGLRGQLLRRRRTRTTTSACRWPGAWDEVLNTDARLRRQRRGQPRHRGGRADAVARACRRRRRS